MSKYVSCEVIASILGEYPYASSEEISEFISKISPFAKQYGGVVEYIYLHHPQLRGHKLVDGPLSNDISAKTFLEYDIKNFCINPENGFSFDVLSNEDELIENSTRKL